VRSSVEYAYAHVPYYRETMDRLGLRPIDFHDASDLARLPVIERQDLQRDPDHFVATAQTTRGVKLQSGGSTGEPVTVFRDPFSIFEAILHAQRQRSLVAKIAGRLGHFREVRIVPPTNSGEELRRVFRGQSLLSMGIRAKARRLSLLAPPSENVLAIDEFQPDVITSYGSYLEALFVYLETSGRRCHLPKAVTYGADALSDSARRLISERYGVSVLSRYDAIESGQVGFECEAHQGYHLNMDFCPIRIVDADGRDVREGESGDVVISDLTNRATVLLNYRLGDVARMQPGPCECGRSLPMLSFLEGRKAEWLESPSGKLVHPQAVRMLLRTEDEVWRYQVIQRGPDHFDVMLVTTPACDRELLRHRVAGRFADQFGTATVTAVSFVDDLPRTPAGKVRSVISQYDGSPVEAAHHGAL
jgi:phenylacetate-CoA ligase